jgi:hypothetical protein
MHFHLPKPLHGWREFAGEVGIIVVGVLIALAAEQVVEKLRWRSDVAEARESLNADLAEAKVSSLQMAILSHCRERKLDRIDAILNGSELPPNMNTRVIGFQPWMTSSWEAATASGAVAHMSVSERVLYTTAFGFLRSLGDLHMKAFAASSDLSTLQRHPQLTDVARDRLESDVASLRNLNSMLVLGSKQFLELAKPLHLHVSPKNEAALAQTRQAALTCPMPDGPAAHR